MDDLDIWRTAKVLIDAHGPQTAWLQAARHAADLAHDASALAVWLRVIEAIDEMTRVQALRGDCVH